MVDDEPRVGMAIDERSAGVEIVPAQDVDRKVVANGRARIRSRPGSSASRLVSFVSMMRIPTAPGVFFQSATTSATVRIIGVDRLDDGEPAGMGPLHLHGIAGVVAVHAKKRR